MRNFEVDYVNLVSTVITAGDFRSTRAGPTLSMFGTTLQIDCLEQGLFPVLTQRKIQLQGILGELAAFLRGATDLQTFKDFGCNYWDANAAAWAPNKNKPASEHMVGRIYGAQWRQWPQNVDQLFTLVQNLKSDPGSRRHLLTTYNPAELENACLPPCHLLAQYNVRKSKLDCIIYMRSVDLCLGLPSDIILYATLLLVLCNETGYTPGKLTFMLADTHVYLNHVDQFQIHAVKRMHDLPGFALRGAAGINTFVPEDLKLLNYTNEGVLSYAFNV